MEEELEPLRCRVCGLLQPEPPWGADGRTPSFDICPCCGVEAGYEDCTPAGVRRFRERWVKAGAGWFEPRLRPASWELAAQLDCVPERFK